MFNPVAGIKDLQNGIFLSRANRFIVDCLINGRRERAYLPNPGRLIELLQKGRRLYLLRNDADKKTGYTVIAVERDGMPVLLHTHYMNDVAAYLIENDLIKGLEGYRIKKREYSSGGSRFDFLLEKGGRTLVVEAKSCTLFVRDIAMFPDAVTERGRRHILHMVNEKRDSCILFIVNSPYVRYFMPDYHTDLSFSRALFDTKDRLMIRAIGIGWKKDLSLSGYIRELKIPWKIIGDNLEDRGSYILLLYLGNDSKIAIGELGTITFKRGYYLYVGSGTKNLSSRINRHRRLKKKRFWHIDYLREEAHYVTALPIRTKEHLECIIAQDLRKITDLGVNGFGSSDCRCESHLFFMRENPLLDVRFVNLLLHYRIDGLEPEA